MPISRLEEFTVSIHETLADSSVKRLFGRKSLAHQEQARRIVWVRTRGDIEAPRQAGGREVPPATTPPGGTTYRVRACCLRIERVEAHIFAEDDEKLDALLDNLLAAIYLTIPTPSFSGFAFPSQEEGKDGESLRTQKCVLTVAFRCPVPDEIKPLAPITGFTTTAGTLTQDDTVVPEPGGVP